MFKFFRFIKNFFKDIVRTINKGGYFCQNCLRIVVFVLFVFLVFRAKGWV